MPPCPDTVYLDSQNLLFGGEFDKNIPSIYIPVLPVTPQWTVAHFFQQVTREFYDV